LTNGLKSFGIILARLLFLKESDSLKTGTGEIGSLLKGTCLNCVSVSGLDRVYERAKKIALEPLKEENDGNS
jgi:hypothetical protein